MFNVQKLPKNYHKLKKEYLFISSCICTEFSKTSERCKSGYYQRDYLGTWEMGYTGDSLFPTYHFLFLTVMLNMHPLFKVLDAHMLRAMLICATHLCLCHNQPFGSMTPLHGFHCRQTSLFTPSYHTLSLPHPVPFLAFSVDLRHLLSHLHTTNPAKPTTPDTFTPPPPIGLSLTTSPGSLLPLDP